MHSSHNVTISGKSHESTSSHQNNLAHFPKEMISPSSAQCLLCTHPNMWDGNIGAFEKSCMRVHLINNVVFHVSFRYTTKWISYTCTCIHSFQVLFPFRLLQSIEQNSLCYTVGPCWLSVLDIAVCKCPSQTPNPFSLQFLPSNH